MGEKIEVEFEITERPAFELMQSWIDADRDDVEYSLVCGAGLGNSTLRASASNGKVTVYAVADMTELAPKLFDLLTVQLASRLCRVCGNALVEGECPSACDG